MLLSIVIYFLKDRGKSAMRRYGIVSHAACYSTNIVFDLVLYAGVGGR
jgi:hypothetical protein